MLTTGQQLSLIQNGTCDCRYIDLYPIQKAKGPGYRRSAIARKFTELRSPTDDPNTFNCRKCKAEVKLEHPKPVKKPAAVPVAKRNPKRKSAAKPKRNPEPQSYKDHILQLDADPLEGIINADCRLFFQSVFCPGSGFQMITVLPLPSKDHTLADIGNRSFDLEAIQKDLLEFRRRLALGTADDKLIDELTNEQYCSKFIRDAMVSIHKDWNTRELSDQLHEAYSKELRGKPQWAERLTGEQSLDFIHWLNGKTVTIAALRKMAERKYNLKVPKRNDRYFRDSIVEHYG